MSKQRPSTLAFVLTLPSGRQCTIATYVASWRLLKGMDEADLVDVFFDWPEPVHRILREIGRGVHDRINKRDPRYGHGRKWDPNWQAECARTARAVNTERLIVRQVIPDYYDRLRHRVWSPETPWD